MLHLSAEPFRVIFEALGTPTVQEPVSMAASMFEALDAATVREVDFTAASILAALDASIENLSAVSVTSLVIRAALDASSARMRPLAGTVTVTSAFDTLLTDLSMGRRQASALGLHHYVFHNVVVGFDRDFAGRLAGDDDLHGAVPHPHGRNPGRRWCA